MTFAAGDAHLVPIYAGRYRAVFPLLDADGDLVTGATTPDSEVSINCGTFADCTNEMTEIATNSGMYFLDLTAAEMTGSVITVIAKTATAGAKTTPLVLYVRRMPIYRSGTAAAGGGSTITLDSGASTVDAAYVGMYIQCSNNTPANVQGQTRRIISYVGSTKVATVGSAWGTNPSSSTTFDMLIPETVGVATVTPDAINTASFVAGTIATAANVAAAVWDEVLSGHLTAGTTGKALSDASAANPTAAQVATAVWQDATAGDFTVASSIGKNLYAANTVPGGAGGHFIAGTNAATSITTALTANIIGNVTGNLSGSIGSVGTNGLTTASFTAGAITSSAFASGAINAAAIAPDAIGASELATDAATEIANLVWDTVLASHLTAGTTGLALNSASSAGDPWATALPGAYGAGTAGNLIGNRLDAAITSRLAPTVAARTLDVTAGGEAGIDWANIGSPTTAQALTGTTIATSQVVASVTGAVGSVTAAGTLTSGERNAVADAMLDRTDAIEVGMTPRQSLRGTTSKLFGKVSGGSTGLELFRNAVADSKTRITFTDDSSGNRTNIVTDLT